MGLAGRFMDIAAVIRTPGRFIDLSALLSTSRQFYGPRGYCIDLPAI
jgi:hypothetical protein